MRKLYRNRYMIGVYSWISEGETLLALVDNVREFAKLMNIKESTARVILNNLFLNKTKYIRYFGRIRTVEFIEDIPETLN